MISRNLSDVAVAGLGAGLTMLLADQVNSMVTEKYPEHSWLPPVVTAALGLLALYLPLTGTLGTACVGAGVGALGMALYITVYNAQSQ